METPGIQYHFVFNFPRARAKAKSCIESFTFSCSSSETDGVESSYNVSA